MNLKLIIAVSVLAAMPTLAHAQAAGAKPTKADAQKVVQIISSDKTKTATFCAISKLGEQMDQAEQKKDQKKMQDLGKQMDEMGKKLGPEYVSLMAGLEAVDPESKEGKDIAAALEPLDKLCPK